MLSVNGFGREIGVGYILYESKSHHLNLIQCRAQPQHTDDECEKYDAAHEFGKVIEESVKKEDVCWRGVSMSFGCFSVK